MMIFLLFCLLSGLYGVLGKDQKDRFSIPVLDVKSKQLILDTNQTLVLNCRGRWELSWDFPPGLSADRVQVEESLCGRSRGQHCSLLRVSSTRAQHTGPFRCSYRQQPDTQASVYVYVADSQQPFVEQEGMDTDVLFMMEKQPLVFPCRVTQPNLTPSLVKESTGGTRHSRQQNSDYSLDPDQRNIIWDSKQGFTIRSPTFFYIDMFFCETRVNNATYKSRRYIVHRLVNNISEVKLNVSERLQTLKGQRLVLNCTATAELNSRADISWDYPGKNNPTSSTYKRIVIYRTYVLFFNILTIPNLQRSDRGLYKCSVSSGDKFLQRNVSVTVYDHPFIRLKPRRGSVIEVQAGQKSYRITPKLRAFPPPEIIWLKDGTLAAEQCSRYRIQGNSLVIRDVAEEDAGKYTVLAQMKEHGLYKNLTLTLVVNVRPQIGEKAVSLRDPGSVRRGSRQTLRCTSHGLPAPSVRWLWHRCPSTGLPAAPRA